jgi:hypothetical protein
MQTRIDDLDVFFDQKYGDCTNDGSETLYVMPGHSFGIRFWVEGTFPNIWWDNTFNGA